MQLKYLLILLTLCILPTIGNAQLVTKEGKITFPSGEVKNGYILINESDSIYIRCLFKDDLNGKTTTYRPGEIIEYEINNGKRFKSVAINQELFVEVLAEGDVSLYHFKLYGNGHHYVYSERFGLQELKFSKKLVDYKDSLIANESAKSPLKYNTTLYEIKTKEFNQTLKKYLSKKPELYRSIDWLQEPTSESYINIIDKYNNLIAKETGTIPYKRKVKAITFEIGTSVGIYSIFKYSTLDEMSPINLSKADKIGFSNNIDLNILFPSYSEKFFLKTGIYFFHTKSKPQVIIPLLLTYRYPIGRFRPEISYGVNIWLPLVSTVKINLGLDAMINNNLSAKINLGVDFYSKQLLIAPSKPLYVDANIGIMYRF